MAKSGNGYSLSVELVTAVVAVLCLCHDGGAQTKPRSLAERWVAERVRAGKVADLNESPYKSAPTLSAAFLRELLTSAPAGAKDHPNGVQIKSATIAGFVDLAGMEIPFDVLLESCRFEDQANCYLTHFMRNLFLNGTRFNGGVNFNYTEIANILVANSTQFGGPDQLVVFDSMKVGRDAFFRRAIFQGKVSFAYASIGGDLVAHGTQFTADQDALFTSMKIGGSIYLGDDIVSNENRLSTSFSGKVDFRFTNIGGNFDADGIHFEKVSQGVTVDMDGMTVTGHIFLRKAVFRGIADFRRTHAGGDFEVSESRFKQPPSFLYAHVGDTAYFDGTRIKGLARFEGMRYQIIGAGSNLKELFENHSEYSADVYANLEDVFQRHGETEIAKYFHVAGRQRERSELWQKHRSIMGLRDWVWDYVQDVVAGYGRHLERANYVSIGFIVVGCIVFRKEKWMETQNSQEASRYAGRYHPMWYSAALFLPIINLPDAKIWMPQRDRKIRRLYMRVHIIFGYLLIPIGLAAWTGIIK